MASDPSNIFGFELLYKSVETQLNKKEDVLIALVHWYFVKTGFRCIGTGDSKNLDPADSGSELLPDDWNEKPNYALRYVKEGKLYILLGAKSDADILLNLMQIEDHSVSNVQFPIETTVAEVKGQKLETLIPTFQNVLNTVRTELVDPVYSGNARETSTQTSTENVNSAQELRRRIAILEDDPLMVEPLQRPNPALARWNPRAEFGRIGSSDLNPFGALVGGGMIFDPFSRNSERRNPAGGPGVGGLGVPGRLPPDAVPPGARFDPFGPPDINQPRLPRGPDNDHLPPPGYDDMFM